MEDLDDKALVKQNETILTLEWNKPQPNLVMMKVKMAKTARYRFDRMQGQRTMDTLTVFPYLQNPHLVSAIFFSH